MARLVPTASMSPARNYIRQAVAKSLHPVDTDGVENMINQRWGWAGVKAAASGFERSDSDPDKNTSEFFDRVYDQSIFGSVQGWRRVNFNENMMKATSGSTALWVDGGNQAPVSKAVLDSSSLERFKVSGLAVFSKESLEATGEIAEAAVERDIVSACSNLLDSSFLDFSNAGSAGVSPASVTNGLSGSVTTPGAWEDLKTMVNGFAGDLSQAYFIGDPGILMRLATSTGSNGASLYPDLGPRGGMILGIPCVSTRNAASTGSLALIDPTGIAVALGAAEVGYTQEANILMSDDPENDATPAAVNMFQNDLVAMKIVIPCNWSVQRSGAVSVLVGGSEW